MLKRIYSFGERITGEVLLVNPGTIPEQPQLVMVADQHGEGQLLVFVRHDIVPKIGMRVVMEFTQGGVMKGYWKIISEAPAKDAAEEVAP